MNLLRHLTTCILALGLSGASLAHAADDAGAAKRKRDELQAKQAEVARQLGDLRREIEKTEPVAAALKAAADAKRAYDAKVAASAKVAAARKAVDDATAAARAITDAEMSADHAVLEAQEALAALDDATFDAESQLRVAGFVMSEIRRKAARAADLKPLKAAEAKATEAFYAARQANKDVAAATAARAAASKAYEDALTAKVAASEAGQAQAKKIAELEAKVADARAAAEPALDRLQDAKAEVTRSSAKIARSRQPVDEATAALRDTLAAEAGPERAALDKATQALDETLRAKLDADPKVAALRKQLDGLRQEIREIATKTTQDGPAK